MQVSIYYGVLIGLFLLLVTLVPEARDYLPLGGAEALLNRNDLDLLKGTSIGATEIRTLGGSLAWLGAAMIGALLAALPVSWVYMEIRERHQYDQAIDNTIVILPVVVTGIVIIVQHSLALAFALAGIAGAVRFRNSLKSTGDALFILLSVGIGLAAGIGAIELAFLMSLGFNYCFLILWRSQYGDRGGKHYLRGLDDKDENSAEPTVADAD